MAEQRVIDIAMEHRKGQRGALDTAGEEGKKLQWLHSLLRICILCRPFTHIVLTTA